jgi:hypothetical protein
LVETDMNDSDQDDTIFEEAIPPKPPPILAALKSIRPTRLLSSQTSTAITSQAELDSHADTRSFGMGTYIVADTGQTISVSGFINSLGINLGVDPGSGTSRVP